MAQYIVIKIYSVTIEVYYGYCWSWRHADGEIRPVMVRQERPLVGWADLVQWGPALMGVIRASIF